MNILSNDLLCGPVSVLWPLAPLTIEGRPVYRCGYVYTYILCISTHPFIILL